MPKHYVCITLDFDSVSLWQAMGQTGPSAISRGEFGVIAAQRLLRLFAEFQVPTTWFIPGLTIDTYPDICSSIAADGHEIGHHGYHHIAPAQLDRDAELQQLDMGIARIEQICGRAPRGYRSPAWELSKNTVELLLSRNFVYDSSMMGHDHLPYRARQGDVVTQEQPIQFGTPSELWELPISWSLDDFPHFEYFRGNGLRPAAGVLQNWLEDFRFMQEETDRSGGQGVLTYTLHPFVIGRGHRLRMLRTLLTELKDLGANFLTAEQAIASFAAEPGA